MFFEIINDAKTGMQVTVLPETLTIQIFKDIFDRDKSKTKDNAFKDFSFIYGEDKAAPSVVKNINFELDHGEVLILAGPSGSGKSTLSYAINGIIPWRLKGFMKGDVEIYG